MRQRWEIAQLEIVLARDIIGSAYGGKHFRLLHRIDAQIRFQIKIEVEHIRRIARLLGNDLQDRFFHRSGEGTASAGVGSGFGAAGTAAGTASAGFSAANAAAACFQIRPPVVHELHGMSQGRKVAQFQIVVARNVVGRPDGREHFRLLDRVDPEIGFKIQIEIQHVGWIAGFLGNDLHDLHLHVIHRTNRGSRRPSLRRRGNRRSLGFRKWRRSI